MGKYDKLRQRILNGASDANIDFADLCQLLLEYGFEQRISGSHHIFRREGVVERTNLQRDGNKAKVYQVRQVRTSSLTIIWGRMGKPIRKRRANDEQVRSHPVLE